MATDQTEPGDGSHQHPGETVPEGPNPAAPSSATVLEPDAAVAPDATVPADAGEVFAQLLEINRDDPDLVEELEICREVLDDCRLDGVDETFNGLLEE